LLESAKQNTWIAAMLCCRALDGDVVAVELLPESQWRGASAHLPQADAESTTGVDEEDGDDPEGGHIAQVWVSKIQTRVMHLLVVDWSGTEVALRTR